jgi:hypothetical protein
MRYAVTGPFKIGRTASGRVDRSQLGALWALADHQWQGLASACGVYLFCIQPSGSQRLVPWYVGKTGGTFKGESFDYHKLEAYNSALDEYKACTPYLILVPRLTPGGRFINREEPADIELLEYYFIALAMQSNPRLYNRRDTTFFRELEIDGVTTNHGGHPGTSALALKRALGI